MLNQIKISILYKRLGEILDRIPDQNTQVTDSTSHAKFNMFCVTTYFLYRNI